MASGAIGSARADGPRDLLLALIEADGSAKHSFVVGYDRGIHTGRSLADAVHHLSAVYGNHPGVVEIVSARGMHPVISNWLAQAMRAMERERTYLTRVVVAAGPLPSTPGQAESQAAVMGQRHAIEMLAKSDRAGCALGAAIAKVLDWAAIRHVIDAAAVRFGVDPPALILPTREESLSAAQAAATSIGIERAMSFGAQQVLVQHRGLWDLLEAREIARRGS